MESADSPSSFFVLFFFFKFILFLSLFIGSFVIFFSDSTLCVCVCVFFFVGRVFSHSSRWK